MSQLPEEGNPDVGKQKEIRRGFPPICNSNYGALGMGL